MLQRIFYVAKDMFQWYTEKKKMDINGVGDS